MTKHRQGGWGWRGSEGYCDECAPYCSGPVEPFSFAPDGMGREGLAVDYCCNCGKQNPNHDETVLRRNKPEMTSTAAAVLEALRSESFELSTRQVAERIKATPEATFRALRSLEAAGLVKGTKRARYVRAEVAQFGGAVSLVRRYYSWKEA